MQSRNESILDNATDEAKSSTVGSAAGPAKTGRLPDQRKKVELQMQRDEQWLDSRATVDEETEKQMLAAKRRFRPDAGNRLPFPHQRRHPRGTRPDGGRWPLPRYFPLEQESEELPEMDKWDRKWIGGLAKLGGKLKAIEEGEGTFSTYLHCVWRWHGRRPH